MTCNGEGMPESYHIRLEKDYCVFSAAHFITFNGNICERLHGHNYRTFAEVPGGLDENGYVVDFIALRDSLKQITDRLDHHMLLPTQHAAIHVTAGTTTVPFFPYIKLFATGAQQLWASLVEKAYAKAHGSYQSISGGWVAEALL